MTHLLLLKTTAIYFRGNKRTFSMLHARIGAWIARVFDKKAFEDGDVSMFLESDCSLEFSHANKSYNTENIFYANNIYMQPVAPDKSSYLPGHRFYTKF